MYRLTVQLLFLVVAASLLSVFVKRTNNNRYSEQFMRKLPSVTELFNQEVRKSCCCWNKGFHGMHLEYGCNFQTFTRVLLVHVSISVCAVVYTLSPRTKLQLVLKFFHMADNSLSRSRSKRLRWSRGSVLPLSTQVCGFKPGRSRQDFSGWKNPQHAFLRRGSKAVGAMSQICGM